jgi:hypothetical protein
VKYKICEENLAAFTEEGPSFDEFKNKTRRNTI